MIVENEADFMYLDRDMAGDKALNVRYNVISKCF